MSTSFVAVTSKAVAPAPSTKKMPEITTLAGGYVGRSRVREGMEGCLAPVEKKRFLKNTEEISLELRPDRTFTHKGIVLGSFELVGDKLKLQPLSFNGQTLEQMQTAAEEMGRAFGLAWLFNAFELMIQEATLVSDSKSVIYTEYTRV